MLLEPLVSTIETIKERIDVHGPSLRASETRTRMALIDPLLQALGWDTSDPAMVLPEYDVSGRKADYALLDGRGRPSATLEAKKLGEPLAPHRMQMLNYSNASDVEYAGLTDGDKWELYEVFSRGQLEDRRVLDLSIAETPAPEAALKLLLLWRANLSSGQPVAANAPVIITQEQVVEAPVTTLPITQSTQSVPLVEESTGPDLAADASNWKPLSAINYKQGDNRPVGIRFSGSDPKPIKNWVDTWFEVCEWLAFSGKLSGKDCPVPSPSGVQGVRVLVNTTAVHPPSKKYPDGNDFSQTKETSTGLSVEINYNPQNSLRNAKYLLSRFGVETETVELRFE